MAYARQIVEAGAFYSRVLLSCGHRKIVHNSDVHFATSPFEHNSVHDCEECKAGETR